MAYNIQDIENRLWQAADELRANSGLSSSEYGTPVLGLIFLRYAGYKFQKASGIIAGAPTTARRTVDRTNYQAMGVMYVPEEARFSYLLNLPEGSDIGGAVNDAMRAIEAENEELKGVLPKNYNIFENRTLVTLLKNFNSIQMDMDGDVIGRIYEYFLGKFAMVEGRGGGEFYTPTSIVRLIVEIIEPFHGMILDPAAGSGGMFVQSARFVERHKLNPSAEISVYGEEKAAETVRLCKLNLAIHGLSGDVKQGNTYYEDIHRSKGRFDFVMANPPFNVNSIDKDRVKDDPRFPFGLPSVDNGNYLWIEIFYSALKETGRAGFVMANSASDARASELEIRKKIIESGAVDVIVVVSPNFFYTVTLPVTLWFFDKGKAKTGRKDKVLFIDARHIFRQIDRAHRDFTPRQLEYLANIVRLYRDEETENMEGSDEMLKENFADGKYADIPGLCKVAAVEEIKEHDYSLNPGRYVGVAQRAPDEFEFSERLEELNEELEVLNSEAKELEEQITNNVASLLGA
jgi:type I restriction enzyme M protein